MRMGQLSTWYNPEDFSLVIPSTSVATIPSEPISWIPEAPVSVVVPPTPIATIPTDFAPPPPEPIFTPPPPEPIFTPPPPIPQVPFVQEALDLMAPDLGVTPPVDPGLAEWLAYNPWILETPQEPISYVIPPTPIATIEIITLPAPMDVSQLAPGEMPIVTVPVILPGGESAAVISPAVPYPSETGEARIAVSVPSGVQIDRAALPGISFGAMTPMQKGVAFAVAGIAGLSIIGAFAGFGKRA